MRKARQLGAGGRESSSITKGSSRRSAGASAFQPNACGPGPPGSRFAAQERTDTPARIRRCWAFVAFQLFRSAVACSECGRPKDANAAPLWESLTDFDPLGSTTLSQAHQAWLPTAKCRLQSRRPRDRRGKSDSAAPELRTGELAAPSNHEPSGRTRHFKGPRLQGGIARKPLRRVRVTAVGSMNSLRAEFRSTKLESQPSAAPYG